MGRRRTGGGWLLRTLGSRVEMRFRDRATIELEAHVARLQGTITVLEHHERPEYLDRLQLLREQVFLLNHLYPALMGAVGSAGRLLVTVVLLMTVHPALLLLAAFAIPTVLASTRRAAVERRTEEQASSHRRLARHLFELGTAAGPAKELRVGGLGPSMNDRRRAAWQAWYDAVSPARRTSAAWYAGTWSLFGLGYLGAVVFVASGLDASPGDVLLVLAAGANLSRYLGVTVGEAEFLRWTLDASQRLVWLEQLAAAHDVAAPALVPDRLTGGVRFEAVSFAYPGTTASSSATSTSRCEPARWWRSWARTAPARPPWSSCCAASTTRPPGGSPSTAPTSPASRPRAGGPGCPAPSRTSSASSTPARRSVGVGDLPRADDRDAVLAAVGRAGAVDVVDRLPAGIDTQLGVTWDGGVELSVGQWQKLALARGFMRDRPLVCVLDEPTAALDAATEHALFERFAAASREAAADGRITVLVSHRFSTVRMADQIAVVDGSRVAESGSHEELMAVGGLYAELYETQAGAYR